MQSRNKPKFIILIMIGLLMLLLICMVALMLAIQFSDNSNTPTVSVSTDNQIKNKDKLKTVKEVVEYHDSEYLTMDKGVMVRIYIKAKYNLFDEKGRSKENYFRDMIKDIVEIQKDSFYLIDSEKKIEIYVKYDKETGKFTITINNQEDFYENVDGEVYVELEETEIVKQSDMPVINDLISVLAAKNMYYSNTMFVDENRVQLENGYYSYEDGKILAKLGGGRILNLVLNKDYEEEIARGIYVGTKLKDIEGKYSNLAWGSVKDGFLAYRVSNLYVFFYEDEVSIYGSQYQENSDFDTYLSDYCSSGDLDKLASDFKDHWANYYNYEYNPDEQKLYISYPSRGIEIDINGGASTGIKIYNNYYLTDTVKELIKAHKITLESNKNLVYVTEQIRRESMR